LLLRRHEANSITKIVVECSHGGRRRGRVGQPIPRAAARCKGGRLGGGRRRRAHLEEERVQGSFFARARHGRRQRPEPTASAVGDWVRRRGCCCRGCCCCCCGAGRATGATWWSVALAIEVDLVAAWAVQAGLVSFPGCCEVRGGVQQQGRGHVAPAAQRRNRFAFFRKEPTETRRRRAAPAAAAAAELSERSGGGKGRRRLGPPSRVRPLQQLRDRGSSSSWRRRGPSRRQGGPAKAAAARQGR
jgi:hypothetical protein